MLHRPAEPTEEFVSRKNTTHVMTGSGDYRWSGMVSSALLKPLSRNKIAGFGWSVAIIYIHGHIQQLVY